MQIKYELTQYRNTPLLIENKYKRSFFSPLELKIKLYCCIEWLCLLKLFSMNLAQFWLGFFLNKQKRFLLKEKSVIWDDIIHKFVRTRTHEETQTDCEWMFAKFAMNGILRTAISHHTGSERNTHKDRVKERSSSTQRHIDSLCPLCGKRHKHTLTHTDIKNMSETMNTVVKSNTSCFAIHTHIYAYFELSHTVSFVEFQFINWKFETARKFTLSVYSKCHANRVGWRTKSTRAMSQFEWKQHKH